MTACGDSTDDEPRADFIALRALPLYTSVTDKSAHDHHQVKDLESQVNALQLQVQTKSLVQHAPCIACRIL